MKPSIESGKPKKEGLSPKEKEIAMSLETISCLEKKDKVFLVLVWKGLKTATAISLEPGVPESVARDLEKRVKETGLLFKKTDHIIAEEMFMVKQKARGLRPGRVCFVANNQKDFDLISELWFGDHDKDQKVYRELGRMSGFPQTAIDIYQKISQAEIFKLSEEEQEKAMGNYVFSEREKRDFLFKENEPRVVPFSWLFYMSKENWKSEMATPRKWAKEIESTTPTLYEEFTGLFYRSAMY